MNFFKIKKVGMNTSILLDLWRRPRILANNVPRLSILRQSGVVLYVTEKFWISDAIKGHGIQRWMLALSRKQLAILRIHPLHMEWILAWIKKEI